MHADGQGDWTCPTCARPVAATPYCAACGERRLDSHDRSIVGLLEQWVETVFHVDGRLGKTLLSIWRRPGELTAAYAAGRRRPFLGPFQLFLAVGVVFFFVQLASGLTVASLPLESHLHHQDYSAIAREWYAAAEARHAATPPAAYADAFEHRERTVAKTLLPLLVPLFALASALVFVRRPAPGPTHVVFAIHFVTAMMTFLAVAFPLLALLLVGLRRGGAALDFGLVDTTFSYVELAAIAGWLWLAVPRVFDVRGAARVLAVVVLAAAVPYMLYAYRFIVFTVAVWTG